MNTHNCSVLPFLVTVDGTEFLLFLGFFQKGINSQISPFHLETDIINLIIWCLTLQQVMVLT